MCLAHRGSWENGRDESRGNKDSSRCRHGDFSVSICRAVCIARSATIVPPWHGVSGRVIAISGGLAGLCQAATAGSHTSGSSLKGAMVSSVI